MGIWKLGGERERRHIVVVSASLIHFWKCISEHYFCTHQTDSINHLPLLILHLPLPLVKLLRKSSLLWQVMPCNSGFDHEVRKLLCWSLGLDWLHISDGSLVPHPDHGKNAPGFTKWFSCLGLYLLSHGNQCWVRDGYTAASRPNWWVLNKCRRHVWVMRIPGT